MPGAVELATGYISLAVSTKNLGNQISKEFSGIGRKSGDQLGRDLSASTAKSGKGAGKQLGAGLLGGVKGIAGPMAALFAVGNVVNFFKDANAEARESQKVGATTTQIIKSTGGAAKVTSSQVGELAGAISRKTGVDDEAVQKGANLLLTFKNVSNEAGKGSKIFDRATQSAVDLSAAGFGSVDSASKMLGKALNDPLKGISALSRAGVTFTDQQKEQIKTLVESGDVLGAQKIILGEVESQVGGVAAASATAGEKMSVAWGNFKEQVGTALLPIIDKLADFMINRVIPAASQLVTYLSNNVGPAFARVKDFIVGLFASFQGGGGAGQLLSVFKTIASFITGTVVPAFMRIASAVRDLYAVVIPIIIQIVSGILGKFKTMSPQIQGIWNSIKEIITGVMFIIREVIQSVTTIIRGIWDRWGAQIMSVVKTVFGGLVNIIGGVLKTISGIIKLFVALIKGDWTGAWNAVKQIFSGIWQALKGILTVATAGLRSTLTAWLSKIKSLWTSAVTAIRTAWATFWTNIRNTAQAAWNWVQSRITTVWNTIRNTWTRTQTAVRSAWSTFWGNIKSTGAAAIDAVRTKITTVLDRIKAAFQTAKDNIGRIWAGVKGVVSSPVEWIKNNVYNKPLVPVWNRVAGLVNGPTLKAYARGGVLPGYEPGRDSIPIMASKGEGILRPEVTRALGKDWIDEANRAARRGAGRARRFAQGQVPGFAGGGIVGWMKGLVGSAKSKVGDLKDWVLGGLFDVAKKVLDPVKTLITNAMPKSGVGSAIGGIGHKAIDLILNKIKADDAAAMPAGGPAGSAIAAGGWASIYRILRAVGARSFTTYPGHDQGPSRSRDIWPPSQRIADTARRINSIWYVIYNRRIASITRANRAWLPYRGSNPHTDHVHATLRPGFSGGGIAGLEGGGIVRGGKGGMLAMIGEGRHDELVLPLPKGLDAASSVGGVTINGNINGYSAAEVAVEIEKQRRRREALQPSYA